MGTVQIRWNSGTVNQRSLIQKSSTVVLCKVQKKQKQQCTILCQSDNCTRFIFTIFGGSCKGYKANAANELHSSFTSQNLHVWEAAKEMSYQHSSRFETSNYPTKTTYNLKPCCFWSSFCFVPCYLRQTNHCTAPYWSMVPRYRSNHCTWNILESSTPILNHHIKGGMTIGTNGFPIHGGCLRLIGTSNRTSNLVGGFNPSEKYVRKKGNLPQGAKNKNNTPRNTLGYTP